MCGIVGYIGKKKALPILIKGLKRLEYRGYDSAGVAYFLNDQIHIKKSVGRIDKLENIINLEENTTTGIGHTRWATHGKVDTVNSHPHQVNHITIVHNGIIENYQELKQILIEHGYQFQSDTDTEIACSYIDYLYQQSENKDMVEILTDCMKRLKGSYAIVIMVDDFTDQLFVIKKDSPLIVGIGKGENYVASDISAYAGDIDRYVILNDLELGIITCDQIQLYKDNKEVPITTIQNLKNIESGEKKNYEQIELVEKWNQKHLDHITNLPDLSLYQKIEIIGCGTAYHAGMVGKYLIEQFSDFEIHASIASEYRYKKIYVDQNTLVIFISQSGETADTLACIKKVKECGAHTLGIVNVENSSIARIVDEVIYTEAGPEIAVASTKAYLAQIYILSLLAINLGISKRMIYSDSIKKAYQTLPTLLDGFIHKNYEEVIDPIWKKEDIFYLGRNIDYVSMLEGSLKLKEISYIHSEAMPAGELKHGTISLIEKDTPVIALITKKELANKTISNLKEVKARGAYVILLITNNLLSNLDQDCYDKLIVLDQTEDFIQPLLNIIPLQLIAYHVAKKRGCDIDKPRNLAKSVTVE